MTELPAQLPRVPLGFKQRHLQNLDGIAIFGIHTPDGTALPITWRHKIAARHDYDFRGYSLNGDATVYKTWGEVVAAWPTWFAAHQAANANAPKERRRG